MTRFLLGIASGLAAGFVASVLTSVEPWWLAAGAVAAVLVWFGRWGVELIADALDDLF